MTSQVGPQPTKERGVFATAMLATFGVALALFLIFFVVSVAGSVAEAWPSRQYASVTWESLETKWMTQSGTVRAFTATEAHCIRIQAEREFGTAPKFVVASPLSSGTWTRWYSSCGIYQ